MTTAVAPPLLTQMLRYGATGLLNTGLGLAVIIVLYKVAGLPLLVANLLGYSLGLLVSFTLNRAWTFAHDGDLGRSALLYVVLVGFAFGLSFAVLSTLLALGLPYGPAQLAGVLSYSATVFWGARHVVFAPEVSHGS